MGDVAVPHESPPYSSYIAVCDYFLFPETGKTTRGFLSNDSDENCANCFYQSHPQRADAERFEMFQIPSMLVCLARAFPLSPRRKSDVQTQPRANWMNLRKAGSRKKQFLSRYMHKTGLIQRAFISLGERAVAIFRGNRHGERPVSPRGNKTTQK